MSERGKRQRFGRPRQAFQAKRLSIVVGRRLMRIFARGIPLRQMQPDIFERGMFQDRFEQRRDSRHRAQEPSSLSRTVTISWEEE